MMTLGRFITIICLAFGLSSVASAQTPGGVVNSQQNPFDNIEQMTGQLLIIIDSIKTDIRLMKKLTLKRLIR